MAGLQYALTLRSKGQRWRSHGYENHHSCTVTDKWLLLWPCAAAAAGMGSRVVWLLSFLVLVYYARYLSHLDP